MTSLVRARAEAPAAEDLLALCAFLAPDDLPRTLPTDHAHLLPAWLRRAATDPLTYNQVLGALGRYSLVRASQDSLVVHRVVQAWVRPLLDRQARQRWARTAVRLVWAAFPADSGEVRAWPTCARLLSHAVAASDHASSLVADPEATAGLLNQVGAYLWWRAEFEQARQPRHRAVRACRGAHRRYLHRRVLHVFEPRIGSGNPLTTAIPRNL